jgi:ABC-type glycerol-3-phosphate transport system permease component
MIDPRVPSRPPNPAMKIARPSSSWIVSWLFHGAVALLAFVFLLPLLWMVTAAFKTADDLADSPFPLSHLNHLTLDNLRQLTSALDYPRWFVNSLFLASCTTVLVVLLSSLGGFALAKFRFAGQKLIMLGMLATMLLPAQVILPSEYELMFRFHWIDTLASIIIPGSVSVFGLFLFRAAMQNVPDELLQCARIDGSSELRLWWQFALPLTKPMTAAFTLITFLANWNSFLWPQIMLQDQGKYTIPIALASLVGLQQYQSNPGLLMAATLLGILPIIVLFFALQRDFISGLASGAFKG